MMGLIPDFDLYNSWDGDIVSDNTDIKIGDRVKIVRFELSYPTYLDWFRNNDLYEYLDEYKFSDLESNKNDEIGIVKAIGRHGVYDNILLYVHLIGGGVILISVNGVELVNPKGEDKMFEIGEKVRIKDNLEVGKLYGHIRMLDSYMEAHKGEVGVIIGNFGDSYQIEVEQFDATGFIWHKSMLEKYDFRGDLYDKIAKDFSSSYPKMLLNNKGEDKMDFTKDDLKTGMVLEDANGKKMKVFLNTTHGDIISSNGNTWAELDFYEDDLTYINNENRTIIKVYDTRVQYKIKSFDYSDLELIWEREEDKYYLYDNFIDEFLNYNTLSGNFSLSDSNEFGCYKSKFTDSEIEEFEIPVERYEKIRAK